MKESIIGLGIFFMIALFILISATISLKKKIYRNYIDPSDILANKGDSKYDGYWFAKDIGLQDLVKNNPEDSSLQKNAKRVIQFQTAFGILFAMFLILIIIIKTLDLA